MIYLKQFSDLAALNEYFKELDDTEVGYQIINIQYVNQNKPHLVYYKLTF